MKKALFTLGLGLGASVAQAQLEQLAQGHLSGSFDSYTQYYRKDDKILAVPPQDKIGSNNFFKLDYTYKQFSAGIQYEAYLPAVQGFPFLGTKQGRNEGKLVNRYFRYSGDKVSLQVGDFYEQFGSGLVFRSWENRQIGINNALEGVNVQIQPTDFLKLKVVYGRPREYFDYADATVRGADADINLSRMFVKRPTAVNVTGGLSYVSRYQEYTGADDKFPATVNAYAARLAIEGANASLGVEYVHKGQDPHVANVFSDDNGKALLINGAYTAGKFGVNLTYRGISNMDWRSDRNAEGTVLPMNYVPALTKQHDYLTTNIYVYNAQVAGETGGQLDVFVNLGSSKLSVNYSQYNALKTPGSIFSPDSSFFKDGSIEWKKKWNSKWQSILSYHYVFYNKHVIEGGNDKSITSHIGLANILYKYAPRKSARLELQHLYTKEDRGNWAAAVTEFTFAPMLSVYASDLYNYGTTKVHYYNIGGSIMKDATRFSLAYGRQRAGLFCVGGVCRYVPAASGLTATLTITFNN
ncbi:hypothetical protein SAMN05421788_10318 [Filimonas lacunae]|uniref:Alginate export domain-containing protein n=1 Tax=Filimonas lacunae TaxID=477680 RepID=A0A173MJU4_9BACT|nr:DUF6029 family protein [Filimonas lacunae]BAV07668.1 hypothetical protein FLA_3699 [Filimonas lacunae]SIT03265.1 hypothetical protein SAMN05421788_10318 [Filimonas lacunae]